MKDKRTDRAVTRTPGEIAAFKETAAYKNRGKNVRKRLAAAIEHNIQTDRAREFLLDPNWLLTDAPREKDG